ncbi:serine-threonine protein kinase 19-domain-containing protein [Stachybotrys elegans]|uniref:Serine-threonine protein kinase 19-domain-containing protein n=1 Tax=Stachybotrys elegans TaxID=80388 RepID=A0A8K0WWG7_9HYPO|nr:serine-threonine protein kinase 19-domain-containing protein [Stachybotrys elegans]
MPQSIRSILGKTNRVRKPSRPTPAKGATSPSPRKARKANDKDDELFQEKLEDLGLDELNFNDLTSRDVVQAMRYIRNRMLTPVPPKGFNSVRTAELLNYRLAMPPIVTASHLSAILHSPTAVERELVELIGKGVIRKIRVDKGTAMGVALIETSDYESMVRKAGLQDSTQEAFLSFLRGNPSAQTITKHTLTSAQEDELIRARFLTSAQATSTTDRLRLRPEDRTTMTSLDRVSQFASGTMSAVGGHNVIHLAGGGGGAPTLTRAGSSSDAAAHLRIAVPGHGQYMELAGDALAWLRQALGRTRWGEAPESYLRERFEGAGLYGPRWRDRWGVEWEWLLGQAVGLGMVEVFKTGSVGRGVRALA